MTEKKELIFNIMYNSKFINNDVKSIEHFFKIYHFLDVSRIPIRLLRALNEYYEYTKGRKNDTSKQS